VEAEAVIAVEGNISAAAMRGSVAPPWSLTPSRTKRTRRNLGDLASDRTVSNRPGPHWEGEEP
jgi:hypothetical protein